MLDIINERAYQVITKGYVPELDKGQSVVMWSALIDKYLNKARTAPNEETAYRMLVKVAALAFAALEARK